MSRGSVAPYVRKGDWVGATRFVAQRLINQGLDPHTRARLLYEPESKRLNRHVFPRNLLGAIWVQTAAIGEGGRTYRHCEQCRGWFVLSPEITDPIALTAPIAAGTRPTEIVAARPRVTRERDGSE